MKSKKIKTKIELSIHEVKSNSVSGVAHVLYRVDNINDLKNATVTPVTLSCTIKTEPKTLKEWVDVNDICVYDLFEFVKDKYKR